ncbi:MAG TPA: hypothetical protein PLB45_02485 [Bacilli bacterium]|nr:hypothetical protein [Bacilli bacterium]HPZ23472.1 hypothetical protein [Bacilli bacterium]HQC83724.1 hypothetical protein [Bacilli bacterium]
MEEQNGNGDLLSPWAYFGYNILFNIPIVGFILLIIFSFDNSNTNRRNYARSFFCIYGLVIIIIIILLICGISFDTISNTISQNM